MPPRARTHWPEYLIEAAGLGFFMLSACAFTALLEHPASPARRAVADGDVRRALIGVAMGLTAVTIFYSPWGKRSGAHINPAVTLTFFRLGRVAPRDAACYAVAQFVGAAAGVMVAAAALHPALADPAVHYALTAPGMRGAVVAFAAEAAISSVLMLVVLTTAATPRLARYTPVFAGVLVACYITLEAPLSGMSMNPARSFGSALAAHQWASLWIYFTAPPLGMLAAAELFVRTRGRRAIPCAKMRHVADAPCHFCEYAAHRAGRGDSPESREPIGETRRSSPRLSSTGRGATGERRHDEGQSPQRTSGLPASVGGHMRRRTKIIGLAAAVVAGGGWYAFRPERLFVNKSVNEAFDPGTAAPPAEPSLAMSAATESGGVATISGGRLHGVAHETRGQATVYRLADGRRVLRLTDFATSNGPDIHVYLVAANDASDNATVTKAGFVEIGALKGNQGDQNYAIPPTVDLAKYRTVTVWCRRFGVNFGSAPLMEKHS